jgi:hypothetical protein
MIDLRYRDENQRQRITQTPKSQGSHTVLNMATLDVAGLRIIENGRGDSLHPVHAK